MTRRKQNHRCKLPLLLTCLLPAFALSGCHSLQPETRGKKRELLYAQAYSRATNHFAEAFLLKPAEGQPEDIVMKLAPLLILETNNQTRLGSVSTPIGGGVGTLVFSNSAIQLEITKPAVYYHVDSTEICREKHLRFTYIWFCFRGRAQGPSGGIRAQGFRLTLDSGGQPAIWEVLSDASGLELLFASEGLERAAAADFGMPLPGRRFALERSTAEARSAVVARVLDDGPVPMGPMVYLQGGGARIASVACRCMPVQAKRLAGTANYHLLPWPGVLLNGRSLPGGSFRLGDRNARVERLLRLPHKF